MRLFVAVEIGTDVRSAAAELIGELQQRARRMAPRARVTWSVPERLHLTVRFIGEVDATRASTIQRAFEAAVDVVPFDMSVRGIGAFPRSGPPRVLWAGVAAGDGLIKVEREAGSRLAVAGIPAESRTYNPHLTLARVRDAAGLKPRTLFDGLEDIDLGTSHVEAITLFESRLSPKGSTYVTLQQTALRSA